MDDLFLRIAKCPPGQFNSFILNFYSNSSRGLVFVVLLFLLELVR